MENSSARSANIRVKRYRIDETPENREIRVNIQRKIGGWLKEKGSTYDMLMKVMSVEK